MSHLLSCISLSFRSPLALPYAANPPPPQFLESYKSVTLASMAATFGVSPDFLDAELVRWQGALGHAVHCVRMGQMTGQHGPGGCATCWVCSW